MLDELERIITAVQKVCNNVNNGRELMQEIMSKESIDFMTPCQVLNETLKAINLGPCTEDDWHDMSTPLIHYHEDPMGSLLGRTDDVVTTDLIAYIASNMNL